MRKLSLVLLLVLVSVMLFGMVACNPTNNGNTDTPVIPTPTPDPDIDNSEYLGSQEAWNIFKEAALAEAHSEKDKRYINVDTAFVLGFSKDSYDSLIVARLCKQDRFARRFQEPITRRVPQAHVRNQRQNRRQRHRLHDGEKR